MSLKTLPSQLSYEELIAAMADAPEVENEVLDYTDDVVPFLSNYNVTPGDNLVSKKLLYKLYKTYSNNPQDSVSFATRVGEFVSTKRAGPGEFYCLNQDNFRISQQIFKQDTKIEKTKSLTYQKHFQWFLDGQGVKKGTKWVEGFILFFIYKDFCRSKRSNPQLGYENFHKFLKLHFQYRRLKENRSLWFKVDELTHNLLSEEEKNVIREARKKTKETRRGSKAGECQTIPSPTE